MRSALLRRCVRAAALLSLATARPAAGVEECASADAGVLAQEAEARAESIEERGDFAGAIEAYRAALALQPLPPCGDPVATAGTLHKLGWAEYRAGRLSEAEGHLREAVALHRAGGVEASLGLARALTSLGALLRDRERYELAEETCAEAFAAVPPQDPKADEVRANIHNNLGGLRYYRGELVGAVASYREALRLFDKTAGPRSREVAMALNNVGTVLEELGDFAGARDADERALALKESLFGPDHATTASTVANLAHALDELREDARAEALYARAAGIYLRTLGDRHPNLAAVYEAWGEMRHRKGDEPGAARMLTQALGIRRAVMGEQSAFVGETLSVLGAVQAARGEVAPGRASLVGAVSIGIASGDRGVLWTAWGNLAALLARSGSLNAAVFFAKHAVNLIQDLRREVAALGRPVQRSFLARREGVYRDLVEWLVALGRLSEAEQVMTMLREEEYYDFARSAISADEGGAERASYSAAEAAAARVYDASVARLAEAGPGAGEAAEGTSGARAEDARRLRDEHEAALDQVARSLAVPARLETSAPAESPASPLPPRAAVLRYLVGPSRVRILVTTAEGRSAADAAIGDARLNRLAFELRQAVQDPRADPRPAAQALYQALIAPVEPLLARAQVDRLLLDLDGALRLVPFAALHDGEHYLVERYALSVRTLAAAEPLPAEPRPERVAAFGVSRPVGGQRPLPSVVRELEGIVQRGAAGRDGVVPGILVLDGDFTRERFARTLAQGYPLVHVASHFVFRPGPLARSFLLLGDGSRLTLEQMKRGELSLRGVRLLSLSACSTAVGEGTGGGRELESFGTLAGRLGAREVLATLWSVADLSTATLMSRFYAERGRAGLDDAVALARAQRSFAQDRHGPWAHPFYWAPLLLLAGR